MSDAAPIYDDEIFNNHRGRLGRSLNVQGVALAEIYNRGGRMDEHVHSDPHFWLTVRGRYRVDGSQSRSVGPATLVYTAPGEPHRDRIETPDGFGMTVVLDKAFVAGQLGDVALPPRSAILTNPLASWMARRMRAELGAADGASRLIIVGLALDLLGQLCRGDVDSTIEGSLVKRASDIIAEGYRRPDLSVAFLARELGVHPVHLARCFRKDLGTTPVEFIRAYRCKRAAEMLRAGGDSLAAIAFGCGFGDQSSFTRAFRRSTGVTPGAFRQMSC